MNLEDLRVFKEVAKHANMTKAAESLNFVQSNVTAKMKRLEQKYETKLFYRHKQGVELTSPGKMLLSYAVQTLQLMDDAEKSLKESHEIGRASCRESVMIALVSVCVAITT